MNRDNSYLKGNSHAKGNAPNHKSFRPGMVPWNKGMKGLRVSMASEFKKGDRGLKHVPVGTITIRLDKKSKTPRRWIKIKDDLLGGQRNWTEYAKYIWLRSGQYLQDKMCLHHINNDSLDDRVENLTLVSRREHPKLHNRWNTKNSPGRSGIIGEVAQAKLL